MNVVDIIEESWIDRSKLLLPSYRTAIDVVIGELDKGTLRVAEPSAEGWKVNQWIKKAILLYSELSGLHTFNAGPLEFHDKTELKSGYAAAGVRVVPHAVAQRGAFINKGVVVMPSHISVGAFIDEGTTVDTWATVGSCAQIGKHVHLSGGVNVGGEIEPLEQLPAIIEDSVFVGSRCTIGSGVRVGKEAVLGANLLLTKDSRIFDVTNEELIEFSSYIPERSVVIPGTHPKKFGSGECSVACALIIGKRKESTDKKTSLNDALHDNSVSV